MHQGASRPAVGAVLAAALLLPACQGPDSAPPSRPFRGTAAVGALFTSKNGKLTALLHGQRGAQQARQPADYRGALHAGSQPQAGRVVTFAPGYHDGHFPHGRWIVRATYTDSRWKGSRDPNDDVAFLIAGRKGVRVEKYAGAETLATGTSLPREVRVIGYPDDSELPVGCWARARAFTRPHLRQEVFDCARYTDGTSGGPFLYHVSKTTGTGRVIGVIGGYQQGGDTPAISYSARFLAKVVALYKRTTS